MAKYQVGDKVKINVGTLKKPVWFPAEVIWVHPFGSHVYVKLIMHIDSVKKDEQQ